MNRCGETRTLQSTGGGGKYPWEEYSKQLANSGAIGTLGGPPSQFGPAAPGALLSHLGWTPCSPFSDRNGRRFEALNDRARFCDKSDRRVEEVDQPPRFPPQASLPGLSERLAG